MQVVNKKMCVVVILILVIIEACTLFLMYKSYSNQENILDEVNLNKEINTNMFAIMIEQEDGTYKEDTSNTWPTSGYTYNESMSGCIDINGNKLDGVLTYDSTNNIATVDTGATSYCYLYFSLPKTAPGTILEGEKNISYVLEAGMYRYQGTYDVVDNNYICFGTSSKSECTGNTDAYMYRIIGITEDNQMKLIKKETLNSAVQWWNNRTTDITWPNSLIYQYINDTESTNNYLNSEIYIPTGWESKIATTTWKYGDTTSNGSYKGETIYTTENAWTNVISAKIGLMYIHDYYYAYVSRGELGVYSNGSLAWIHLNNNDTSAPNTSAEWIMSRYGCNLDNGRCMVWSVYSNSVVSSDRLDNTYSVRPVFYLTSDVKITGGTGTSTDPFIID